MKDVRNILPIFDPLLPVSAKIEHASNSKLLDPPTRWTSFMDTPKPDGSYELLIVL